MNENQSNVSGKMVYRSSLVHLVQVSIDDEAIISIDMNANKKNIRTEEQMERVIVQMKYGVVDNIGRVRSRRKEKSKETRRADNETLHISTRNVRNSI